MSIDRATRYLIIAPAWVGDMVMAQTLFKAIIEHNFQAEISILAPVWSRQLASRMTEVTQAIDASFVHGELGLKKRYQLGKSLRQKYDIAIVLPNSFKAALVPFFAKIPVRLGYVGESRYGLLTRPEKLDKITRPTTVERFCGLFDPQLQFDAIQARLQPRLQIDSDNQMRLLQKYHLHPESTPILALCPGAEFGVAKQWPVDYFAKIACAAEIKGYQVIILGSSNDAECATELQKLAPNVLNLAGQTQLLDAVDLLAVAHTVLSNDSGLMHIAAAVDVRTVAIYGPTSAEMTPPLSDKAHCLQHSDLDCRPCFARECPLSHHRCMRELTADFVWQQLDL